MYNFSDVSRNLIKKNKNRTSQKIDYLIFCQENWLFKKCQCFSPKIWRHCPSCANTASFNLAFSWGIKAAEFKHGFCRLNLAWGICGCVFETRKVQGHFLFFAQTMQNISKKAFFFAFQEDINSLDIYDNFSKGSML